MLLQQMLCRHNAATFDYRIGRAMFETTTLPAGWKVRCQYTAVAYAVTLTGVY